LLAFSRSGAVHGRDDRKLAREPLSLQTGKQFYYLKDALMTKEFAPDVIPARKVDKASEDLVAAPRRQHSFRSVGQHAVY
jgi:hypothetical protein